MDAVCYLNDLKKSFMRVSEMLQDDGFFLIKCHQGRSRWYDTHSYFSRYGDNVQGIPTLDSLYYWLEKTGFQPIHVMGMNSPDVLFITMGKRIPALVKGILSKLYNMLMLEYTRWGINKADRLVVLAKKKEEIREDV